MNTLTLGRIKLRLRKKSPEILLVAGIGCMVISLVNAVFAGGKIKDIREDHEARMAEVEDGDKKAATKEILRTGFKIVKTLAGTVLFAGLSVAAFVAMHNIQASIISATSLGYTGLRDYISRYEQNIKDVYGEEANQIGKYGYNTVDVVDEDGTTHQVYVPKTEEELEEEVGNWYMDSFAEWNHKTSKLFTGVWSRDLLTLMAAEQEVQRKVDMYGFAVTNDALRELKMKPTKRGMVEGWVKGGEPVDFGFRNALNRQLMNNQNQDTVYLDFNIHGNVFVLIDEESEKEVFAA